MNAEFHRVQGFRYNTAQESKRVFIHLWFETVDSIHKQILTDFRKILRHSTAVNCRLQNLSMELFSTSLPQPPRANPAD